jgi:hypothetical protein
MISPSHFAQYTEASTSHAAQIPTPASIQPLAPSLVTTIPLTSSQAGTPASGQTAALPVQANTKPSKKSLASATAKAHTESLQQATVDDSGKSKGQRRQAAVAGELQRRNADAKSLNSPYAKLTPILSEGQTDVDVRMDVDHPVLPVGKSNNVKDAVLVCDIVLFSGIY